MNNKAESSPTSPSTPYDFSHLVQPLVIHQTFIIYPSCKHPCQGLNKCLPCLYKENLQWCPRCKQTSIRTLGLDVQQCFKCEFRPGFDCPECGGQNTVSGNHLFQSCEICNWHNESYLHLPMADDLTFTEAEQQPEQAEESFETKKVAKKQARDDAAARRTLMTKEELKEDNQEQKFCHYVAQMLTRLKCKDSERSNLIEASKLYLTTYRKFAQRTAVSGEKKFEPARVGLQEKLQELKAKFLKLGYSEQEFKKDTEWFNSKEPNSVKTRWDQQKEELKIYIAYVDGKRYYESQVKSNEAVMKKYETKLKKYEELHAKWAEAAFSEAGTIEEEPDPPEEPKLIEPKPLYLKLQKQFEEQVASMNSENERFVRWRNYEHEIEFLTRELKRNRAEVGRISDRIASLENLALVALFLLNEQKSFFQFRDLPVFYASATGSFKPPPPTVHEYLDSLKTELGLKELPFTEQLRAQVEGVKLLITRQRQLQFSSGDQARIDRLLPKVEPSSHLALMHVAAAVILNSLCEVNLPSSNKKWSTKFIADATGFHNNKIAEASKALKYKISLLGDLVENKKKS